MELNNHEYDDVPLGRLVPIFLMSSCLYYEHNLSVLTDDQFDNLCNKLHTNWNEVEHMHKHLISQEDLMVGSGYAIEYTNMIRGGAMSWYKTNETKQKPQVVAHEEIVI
tara:strand:+ start:120 stop:446 length:327 start_codon:yes stop_codon:yes gene_type:complete